MTSGVKICDHVKRLIDNMKLVKVVDDTNTRVKLALFTIKEDKIIAIEKTYTHQQLEDRPCFSIISDEMKASDCFYALYDCSFETKDGAKKDDLIFLTWTSDGGPIKSKMIYASSKDSLKACMKGIKHHMHMNDLADWSKEAIANKIQDKGTRVVCKIEGADV